MNAQAGNPLDAPQLALARELATGLAMLQVDLARHGAHPIDAMWLIINTQVKELAALDPAATGTALQLLHDDITTGPTPDYAAALEHPLMLLRCEFGIRHNISEDTE